MSIWILKSFLILSNLKRLLSTFAMGISTMERLRFNRIYDDHCTVKINIESAIKLSSMSESTVELGSLTLARNDDFRLNVLKTLLRLPRVFLDLNKKTPEGVYAGCVGFRKITGMLDGNGKLCSVCNKCVQERRRCSVKD